MSQIKLSQILDPKQNNLNMLRLLAAAAVVISHAVFLQSGHKADEILSGTTYYNLGDHAVNVFFVLSGLTVAASLMRSPSTAEFLVARGLRIFPALAVCAALLVLLGAIVTICTPERFLADTRVWRYGLNTLLLGSAATGLPGVFEGNPHPSVMNASIWTLKYEVACYVILALIGFSGLLRKRRFIFLLALSWGITAGFLLVRSGHAALPIDQAARFWLCFSFGVGLYVFRDDVPLSIVGVLALGFTLWMAIGTEWERIISPFATGYGAVWLAKMPIGRFRDLTNKMDLSYGIYIFGWPITQTLVLERPDLGVHAVVMISLILSASIAVPSWFLVERPALRARKSVMNALRTLADRIARSCHWSAADGVRS